MGGVVGLVALLGVIWLIMRCVPSFLPWMISIVLTLLHAGRRVHRRRELDNIVWPDQTGYYEKMDYPTGRANDQADSEARPYTYGALGTSASGSEPRTAGGYSSNGHEEDIALVPISHQQPLSPMSPNTAHPSPYMDAARSNPGYFPSTYGNMPTPSLAPVASSSAYEHPQAAQAGSSQGYARSRSTSPPGPGPSSQTYLHPDTGLIAVPEQPTGTSSASHPPISSQQRKAARARQEGGQPPREDTEAPPPAYTEGPSP